MLNKDIQEQLMKLIQSKLSPDFILLFGSYAKGTHRAESDIDLAYFSDQQLSSYERFILANELAGRKVDLIDLKQIDTVFTMQIFYRALLFLFKLKMNIYVKNACLQYVRHIK